jgi:diguanylate cyclase (GGDEF)-like protein
MTVSVKQALPEAGSMPAVLIVDKDELVREYLGVVLKFAGYAVTSVGGSSPALLALQTERFEVVMVDWRMPDLDGPALCRQIRALNSQTYIYVVLFTIYGDSQDVVAGLQAGADDYIVKGASMAELVARLESGRRILLNQEKRTAGRRRSWELPDPFRSGAASTLAPHAPSIATELAREFNDCRCKDAPISVLLCALDQVAAVDDRFGTDVRNACLQALRAEVPKYLLDSEWMTSCRRDGLLVVLPGMDAQSATVVAEKIRHALASVGSGFAALLGTPVPTLSIAIVSIDGENLGSLAPADLIRWCEQSLAQTRRDGGNGITARRVQGTSF